MTLRRQVLLGFLLFSSVVLTAVLVPVGYVFVSSTSDNFREQRRNEAVALARALQGSSAKEQRRMLAERFPPGDSAAGWLLDVGAEPGSVYTDRFRFPNPGTAADLREVRLGADVTSVGISPVGDRLFVAIPIIERGKLSKILWVSHSLDRLERLRNRAYVALGASWASGVLLAALLGLVLARRMGTRFEALARGSRRFAEGKLGQRIELGGNDEISEVAEHLNAMATRVDQHVEQQRGFVASASHHIRTPLTAMRLRVEEIQQELGADADPGVAQYLEEILAQIDRLAALSGRLLDLSALDHERRAVSVDVNAALDSVLAIVRPLAGERAVEVERHVPAGTTIEAPAGAFEEIVVNLLDNAVKYSPSGSPVALDARIDGDALVLQVLDRGPGIPPFERERVLQPFYRASAEKPGHGLGLAICARICAEMGASLHIGDRPGRGAIVTIGWPLSGRAPEPAPEAAVGR